MQDRSQPDVFETSDLPEDEQHLDSQVPVCIFKLINVIFVVYCFITTVPVAFY